MLDWIYSEKLKTKSRPDGTIHFHKGLNVILGSRDGTTSIGKSTSLLLIDYAFGVLQGYNVGCIVESNRCIHIGDPCIVGIFFWIA